MFDEIRDALPEELRPQLAAIVNQMVDLIGQNRTLLAVVQSDRELAADTRARTGPLWAAERERTMVARNRAGLFKQRLRVEREAHNTTRNLLDAANNRVARFEMRYGRG